MKTRKAKLNILYVGLPLHFYTPKFNILRQLKKTSRNLGKASENRRGVESNSVKCNANPIYRRFS